VRVAARSTARSAEGVHRRRIWDPLEGEPVGQGDDDAGQLVRGVSPGRQPGAVQVGDEHVQDGAAELGVPARELRLDRGAERGTRRPAGRLTAVYTKYDVFLPDSVLHDLASSLISTALR
jgi:hypothetical protein